MRNNSSSLSAAQRPLVHMGALISFFVCSILAAALAAPSAAFGQSEGIRAAIRSQLSTDPETVALPSETLESMVEALAREAEVQGLTEEDITFVPVPPDPLAEETASPFVEGIEYSAFQKTLITLAGILAFLCVGWFLLRWLRAPENTSPKQSFPPSA